MLALALSLSGEASGVPVGAAAPAGTTSDWTSAAIWSAVRSPSTGPARAIGFYTAGCMAGGETLESSGEGFEVLRLQRGRAFGHPDLLAFVRRLGRAVRRSGLPDLLIGDLTQPRGGPTPSDHRSHQNGLDVDVAFARPAVARARPLTGDERENHVLVPVVDLATRRFTADWNPRALEILRLAADDARVERVFVNARVKRAACRAHPLEPWLRKLRPLWAHHDHFHVRLACPLGSPGCRRQAPVPVATGCGEELDRWLSLEGKALPTSPGRGAPAPRASLPEACRRLVR